MDAPCVFYVMRHDVCMIRHVDAPRDSNVLLWFMYMDANVDALQYFWVFLYILMRCYAGWRCYMV